VKTLGKHMNPANIQTPEQMIERWMGVMCSCDPDVGHLCECCHDIQVVREAIKETDRLRAALKTIAEYGIGADRNDGICPYGCDCPCIAQQALGGN